MRSLNRTSGAARRAGALLLAALLALPLAPPAAARPAGPARVVVPSDAYRTIQDGLNAVAPNGTVLIKPGVYPEALRVDKPVKIVGSGARGTNRTEIALARPTEVVPFDRVTRGGVTYLPTGGGGLSALALTGGDAGILGVATAGRGPAALRVQDVVIEGTGRGIMGRFPVLAVTDTLIIHSLWNGMSIVGQHIKIEEVDVHDAQGTGILLMDPTGTATIEISGGDGFCNLSANGGAGLAVYGAKVVSVQACWAGYNGGPGLAVYGTKVVVIEDSALPSNHEAGVKLVHVQQDATLRNVAIDATLPRADGGFGSGVLVASSAEVALVDSTLQYNAFGVYNLGSLVVIDDTYFYLNTITLASATFEGSAATWGDLGGNTCYEFVPDVGGQPQQVSCTFETLGIAAPPALPDPQP